MGFGLLLPCWVLSGGACWVTVREMVMRVIRVGTYKATKSMPRALYVRCSPHGTLVLRHPAFSLGSPEQPAMAQCWSLMCYRRAPHLCTEIMRA